MRETISNHLISRKSHCSLKIIELNFSVLQLSSQEREGDWRLKEVQQPLLLLLPAIRRLRPRVTVSASRRT
jgi:hypothetical protein